MNMPVHRDREIGTVEEIKEIPPLAFPDLLGPANPYPHFETFVVISRTWPSDVAKWKIYDPAKAGRKS